MPKSWANKCEIFRRWWKKNEFGDRTDRVRCLLHQEYTFFDVFLMVGCVERPWAWPDLTWRAAQDQDHLASAFVYCALCSESPVFSKQLCIFKYLHKSCRQPWRKSNFLEIDVVWWIFFHAFSWEWQLRHSSTVSRSTLKRDWFIFISI